MGGPLLLSLPSVCPRTRHKSYGRWQLTLSLSSASASGTRYRKYARGHLVQSLPSTSESSTQQRRYHRRLPQSRWLYFVGLSSSHRLYFVECPIKNIRQRDFFQRQVHWKIFAKWYLTNSSPSIFDSLASETVSAKEVSASAPSHRVSWPRAPEKLARRSSQEGA